MYSYDVSNLSSETIRRSIRKLKYNYQMRSIQELISNGYWKAKQSI